MNLVCLVLPYSLKYNVVPSQRQFSTWSPSFRFLTQCSACVCHLLQAEGMSRLSNLVRFNNYYDSYNNSNDTVWRFVISFFKWSQLGSHFYLVYLFQLLYMFRAIMCPSSGELTVYMLVFITLYGWMFGLRVGMRLVSSQPADQTATRTEWEKPA